VIHISSSFRPIDGSRPAIYSQQHCHAGFVWLSECPHHHLGSKSWTAVRCSVSGRPFSPQPLIFTLSRSPSYPVHPSPLLSIVSWTAVLLCSHEPKRPKLVMIIDGNKRPLPDDPTPNEAPPSYDTLVQINPPPQVSDLKHTYSTGSSSNRPVQGSSSRSNVGASAYSTPSTSKAPARNWFTSLMGSKTEKDVKATVVGLVRDLVREHYSDSAAPAGILQSCAAACEAHSLDLSKLLQEKSIEGHTPLYWAIVKRKPDEDVDEFTQIPDLLIALLSHATPLTDETIMEIRHACLITSDQKLFQRLRMSPEFAKVSGADQMLLGVTLPNDEIEVEEIPGEDGDFAVTFIVPQFQKRMMVTQHIVLEFIARCTSRVRFIHSRLTPPRSYVETVLRHRSSRPPSVEFTEDGILDAFSLPTRQ